ncbi:hypothetical protein Acr_15g0010590 [Actinidia rufa]|uniref:Uncharacterized protein n=1 Tax=Actinidia rufa TaxID=165716 RepID=A0A7J0FUU7_9ERIC|nr:hypothetical protein Acr_15g0010590 [Actinidia rufa]
MNMESTRAKVEVMKPVLLKAGIPLAISVAGFIFARLTTRKSSVSKALNFEKTQVNRLTTCPHEEPRDEETFYSLDSMFSPSMEDEKQHILTGTHIDFDAEEENLGLKRRIQELQEGWWQLETRFFHYCKMKEQEKVLMELQNNMLLELARVLSFWKESFIHWKPNNRRFEALVVEYLKMLEQLGFARRENGLLRKKIGAEEIQVDDYNKLGIELEKLQKDREAEVKELIFLRWTNACLRHELLRKNQEQQEQTQEKCSTDLEFRTLEGAHSKKPKLIQKIKRWVEGSEKMKEKADEREKRGGKCFQRSLASGRAEEQQISPTNSCSSA